MTATDIVTFLKDEHMKILPRPLFRQRSTVFPVKGEERFQLHCSHLREGGGDSSPQDGGSIGPIRSTPSLSIDKP